MANYNSITKSKAEIWIQTPIISSELEYAFDFISKVSGIQHHLVTKVEGGKKYIDYNPQSIQCPMDSDFWENPSFRYSWIEPTKKCVFNDNFQFTNAPIDIAAFVFWHLSRLEEYDLNSKDPYGRFLASHSLWYAHGLHRYPMVDYWIWRWCQYLETTFQIHFSVTEFSLIPSYDIDYPFVYQNRSLQYQFKFIMGGLFKAKFDRLKVLYQLKDPYDTFEEIISDIKSIPAKIPFFFLHHQEKKEDQTIRLTHPKYKEILSKIKLFEKGVVGIHPSISAHKDLDTLQLEKNTLELVSNCPIKHSRFHFIKMPLPQSYQRLIKAGIQEDFSMGFVDDIGFRAGTAHAFYWFDNQSKTRTKLKVHPFILMDASLRFYLKLNPQQAIDTVNEALNHISPLGGEIYWIWHNSSLSWMDQWEAYIEVYRHLLSRSKV